MADADTQIRRDEAVAALRWLIDAGADEAMLDEPVDRLSARPRAERAAAAGSERPRPTAPKPAAPLVAMPVPAVASVPLPDTSPGSARALAAACRTLAELKQALETIDGGELKRLSSRTVFADGSPDSKIMFIGEAPGRDEDAQGVPFVGRAGRLLNQMIAAMGLERGKVYITNVLPWRPPQNREPSPEEAAIFLPFLRRQIELLRPEIVVLLGAVAVKHVVGGSEGIMRTRGKWQIYQSVTDEDARSVPVMPTLHPAFLLRQPNAKRLAWRDLLAVAEKIQQLGLS